MSLEKTDERLIEFLGEHPEYFEGPQDSKTIRRDLKKVIELYARSIDSEAYSALRDKVVQFQQHAEERLKQKMAHLIEEKSIEEKKLGELLLEFRKYEGRLAELNQEIDRYQAKKESLISDSRGGSDVKSLVVNGIGIFLLGKGLFLYEKVEISFVIMGILCFVCSFFMQSKSKKYVDAEVAPMEALSGRLNERCSRLQEMWRVKEVSLLQQKKASLKKIRQFETEINIILNRIDCGTDRN